MLQSFYKNKNIVVTGGAGFIGSYLVDRLISFGANVRVIDNLSSGHITNLNRVFKNNDLDFENVDKTGTKKNMHSFINIDLTNYDETEKYLHDQEIIFHLAANIGGRGYIVDHPGDCCEGFSINQNIIKAAVKAKVDRVHFASSACVYPLELQNDYVEEYLLKEDDVYKDEWANSDLEYGWAKLMGEKTILAYHKQYGLKGSSARYVTAYGPWENESHAIIALLKRALKQEDPYLIWGTGDQKRDFTYVDDIVEGSLRACMIIENGDSVNLGTAKCYTIKDTVEMIFNQIGWKPEKIFFDKSKPEGVKSRILDNSKAKKLLGWSPQTDLQTGIAKTIAWLKSLQKS